MQRLPIIIVICGTFCIGKQCLVNQLTEVININNTLSTNVVEEVQKSMGIFPDYEDCKNDEELEMNQYKQKCEQIYTGLTFDIYKCFNEGKPLILYGRYLNPSILFNELNNEHEQVKLKILD